MKFPIGYVGVGLMGGPMVKRLTSLGWQVRGYDIVPERSSVALASPKRRRAPTSCCSICRPTKQSRMSLSAKD